MICIIWKPGSQKVGDSQRWTGVVEGGAARITLANSAFHWSVSVQDPDGIHRGNTGESPCLLDAQRSAQEWLYKHTRVRLVPGQVTEAYEPTMYGNGKAFGRNYEWEDRTFVIGERWGWGEEYLLSSGEIVTASGHRFWGIFLIVGSSASPGQVGEIDDILVPIPLNEPNMPPWAPVSLNGAVQWPNGLTVEGLKLPGLSTRDIFPARYAYDARLKEDWRVKNGGWGTIGGPDD